MLITPPILFMEVMEISQLMDFKILKISIHPFKHKTKFKITIFFNRVKSILNRI
jgi:hypothetical protein